MEQKERNIEPISSQEHRDAIPPMFSCEINWSEGFPNMVLSTEYSEAVNARYTFQPLWVSAYIQFYTDSDRYHLRGRDELTLKKNFARTALLKAVSLIGSLSRYD